MGIREIIQIKYDLERSDSPQTQVQKTREGTTIRVSWDLFVALKNSSTVPLNYAKTKDTPREPRESSVVRPKIRASDILVGNKRYTVDVPLCRGSSRRGFASWSCKIDFFLPAKWRSRWWKRKGWRIGQRLQPTFVLRSVPRNFRYHRHPRRDTGHCARTQCIAEAFTAIAFSASFVSPDARREIIRP